MGSVGTQCACEMLAFVGFECVPTVLGSQEDHSLGNGATEVDSVLFVLAIQDRRHAHVSFDH